MYTCLCTRPQSPIAALRYMRVGLTLHKLSAMLEKKPLYRTLGGRRHGVYRGEDKPEAATM